MLAWLGQDSAARDRENLLKFGITATGAFGVSMANIQRLGKQFGRSHELALALWETERYESRPLAALADASEPAPRWIGKDALRDLRSAAALRRKERSRSLQSQ